MIREEGVSSLFRGAGPNVVRAVLMNASQLASYDFFKASMLRSGYFDDNIICHTTASFAAGTVATTVCSPADVLKSRIMNASGPGSSVCLCCATDGCGVMLIFITVNAGCHSDLHGQ